MANLSGNACRIRQFLREKILRGGMEFLRNHEQQAMLLIRLAHLVNLVCVCLFVSNTTPLLLLASFGSLYYFLVHRNNPNHYVAVNIVFFVFVIAFSQFSEPHAGLFRFYRIQLFAFLAGIAVYMAYRKDEEFLYPLTFLYCFIAGAFLIAKFLQTGSGFESIFGGRLSVFAIHPNQLGVISSMAVIASAMHLLRLPCAPEPKTDTSGWRTLAVRGKVFLRSKAAAFLFMLFAFMTTVLTQSRGALFSLLVALAFCIVPTALIRLGFKRFILAVALTAGAFLVIWETVPIKDSLRDTAEIRIVGAMEAPWADQTFKSRIPGWKSSLEMIMKKPFLGHGYRVFRDFHREYVKRHYGELIAKLGKAWVDEDTFNLPHPHNQYLMTGGELGLVGLVPLVLLCFLWPFWAMLKNRTFYGSSGAVLVFFAIHFMIESNLTRMPNAIAGATFLFMILGWLSCAMNEKSGA